MFKSIIDDLEELGGCELISISGGGEPFVLGHDEDVELCQRVKNLN